MEEWTPPSSNGESHLHSSLDLFRTFLLGMNLFTLSSCVHDKELAIRFLQTYGIIHNQCLCRDGYEMHLSRSSDRWTFSYRQCHQEICLRNGTWLELRTVVLFIYSWFKQLTSIQFCHEERYLPPDEGGFHAAGVFFW